MFNTKGRMLQEIVVDLGGRVAEELVFDDITTGASQDIKQATKLAREMVTKYGMSDNIGLICYADDEEEVFIGRDLAHAKNYSEGIASAIDVEVKRIIDESYDKAKSMIAEYAMCLTDVQHFFLRRRKSQEMSLKHCLTRTAKQQLDIIFKKQLCFCAESLYEKY